MATNMDTSDSDESLELHSCQEVDKIMDHLTCKVPFVELQRLLLPDWLENKLQKKGGHLNKEPKRKKIKIEKKGEIPKLILSKNGDEFQSKLKFSNPDMLKNYQESVSDTTNKKVKSYKNKNKKSKKKKQKKSTSKSKMNQPVTNPLVVGQIKVRNVHSINSNFDSIQKEVNCFDVEKPDDNKMNDPLKFELDNNQKNESEKETQMESTSKSKMNQPITNPSLVGKIKVRDVQSINVNYDSIQKKTNCIDKEKSDIDEINDALTFEPLGINAQTVQNFEKFHKKYIGKYTQNIIMIINNTVFINFLTVMDYMSQLNDILSWKDKYVMAQNIQFQTLLHIDYIKVLDNVIKNNCFEIISVFEDSHFEHGLLMFVLILFINLKVFGSDLFKDNNVILKKLERIDWTSVEKNKFDHNKIQTTLKSDEFRSTYIRLSTFIGEGSSTDPDVIKFFELFFIPRMIKISYFDTAVKTILNNADPEELKNSIDEASNKIHLDAQLENDQPCSLFNKIELQKLIALVNNSTQGITSSNDTAEPSTSRPTTLNNNIQFKPAQTENNENTLTQHIVLKNPLRTLKPDTLNEKFLDTSLKNIAPTLIPIHVQFNQVKNSSSDTPLHIDLSKSCQTSVPIQNENLFKHISHTRHLRSSVIHTLNLSEKSPNQNFSNIPEKLETNQVCEIGNALVTVSAEQLGLHKSFNNSLPNQSDDLHTPHTKSIRNTEQNTLYENYHETNVKEINPTSIPNQQQEPTRSPMNHAYLHKEFGNTLDCVDRNEMNKMPKMTTININSNTSEITMYFDQSEKRIGFTMRIQQLQWSINNNTCNSFEFQLLKYLQVSNGYEKDFNDRELILYKKFLVISQCGNL